MRRWLSILLLVFMPFQFCWAAAAPYCEHESDTRATHLGHHEHEHRQLAAESGDDSKSRSGAALDVADCHLYCPCMADAPMSVGMPVIPGTGPLTEWEEPDSLAPFLSRPERPQWVSLA